MQKTLTDALPSASNAAEGPGPYPGVDRKTPTQAIVQVELPAHLCRLCNAPPHLSLAVTGTVTQRTVLDALEARYPALEGTIRDHTTRLRRPFLRFFACAEDLSHLAPDDPLPLSVAAGIETFLIVGAVAGG